jgi:secreted trypsin-like serine protease
MRSVLAVLLLAYYCNAKPMLNLDSPVAMINFDHRIIGGQDAEQGKWIWQLSQQRQSGTVWSHSCGASLLSATKALSASHCVDGSAVSTLRVIAGLYQQTDTGVISTLTGYKMHESYNVGTASYANDIAILSLTTSIATSATIGYLTLPPDNSDQFTGDVCTITGWGRTSASNILPNTLQQVDLTVLSTSECDQRMTGVGGANVWDGHICVYDPAGNAGACNGDSGGPMNCPYSDGYYVTGVTSWVVASGTGACLPEYPSVYTRTSYYLDWIANNS